MSSNETNNSTITNEGNIDPLFISNSDNPASSLVVAIFTGTNFIRWSRGVKRALAAKNKVGFITGDLKEPDITDKDYQKWKRADYMVLSWILSSMSSELADDFAYVESSAELWAEINERFGQANGPMVYQLKKELDALKQENLSILSYYGKIKRLWDEMQSVRRMPMCNCGALTKCTCQFLKKLGDFEAEEKLMQFLLGLNPGYDNTITNILTMDPLPSINRAFAIAQQIEKQKEVSGNNEQIAESSVMAAQRFARNITQKHNSVAQGKRDWKKEKFEKKCEHCKARGHTKDQCFKLIGYPDWYGAIKSAKGYSNGSRMAANVQNAQDVDCGDTPLSQLRLQTQGHIQLIKA